MQPGEGQLHLRLHTRRARHAETHQLSDHKLQQRRLADSRLTTHNQHTTLARPSCLEQPLERLALAASVL